MKNSWLVWIFIVGVVLTVFFAFNQKNDVPFNDIFPENESGPVDIEYEFISKDHNKELIETTSDSVKEAPLVENQSISSLQQEKADKIIEVEEVITTPSPEPAEQKDSIQPEVSKDFSHTIQVASFKKQDSAEKFVSELKAKNFDAFLMAKDVKDAGLWHRVYVGKFNDMKQARAMLEKVQKEYKGSFIISPK